MIKWVFLSLVLVVTGSANIRADFTDYYSFPANNGQGSFFRYVAQSGASTFPANNWSLLGNLTWSPAGSGGPSTPFASATTTHLSLDSGVPFGSPGRPASSDLRLLIIAPAGGLWSFDFNLGLTSTGSVAGYYVINGTSFALPAGSGTVANLVLAPGDTFGFRVGAGQGASSGTFANATLSVTNFSAPVPEPHATTLLLVAAGVATLCYPRRHRI